MKRLVALALLVAVLAVMQSPLGTSIRRAPEATRDAAGFPSTTDGNLAVANLEAQIASEERLLRDRPDRLSSRLALIDLLAMRGQFLGRIADYERSLSMAEALVVDAPGEGRAYLARARARSGLHYFQATLKDLDTAEELGVSATQLKNARTATLHAMGRPEAAEVIVAGETRGRDTMASLTARATRLAEAGEVEEADRLFEEAPRHYRDVSPFPLAWNLFQRGKMWMEQGEWTRAQQFLAEACRRLPAYAPACGHLAEVEMELQHPARAMELLMPLAASSDDPDYAAQLSRILADQGRVEESANWLAKARQRYSELTTRYPEAFADHAAELYLGVANDPVEALRWAEFNLSVRRTPRAFKLLLQAARAAVDTPRACAELDKMPKDNRAWDEVAQLGRQICPARGSGALGPRAGV